MAPRHAASADRADAVRAGTTFGALVVLAAIALAAALLPTNVVLLPSAAAATHGPLRVAAITPSGTHVAPDAALEVRFNNPLAPDSAVPVLAPNVPGHWVRIAPDTLAFRPGAGLLPGSAYLVVVPAATRATSGATLGTRVAHRFVVEPGSILRLNQVLAELGYLPVRFVPTGPFVASSSAVQRGVFAWRWSDVPPALTALWRPTTFNVVTQGALMRFEDAHGLATTAVPDGATWHALLGAVARGDVDHGTYNYVLVSTSLPETLTLYVDFKVVYRTLVNTGISVRPTAITTNPVYLRYTSTTMSGTNPDGSHYSDPGIPWVSYFNGGEALHGYIRSTYGWPQSLGCVEMPFSNAHVVYPYTPLGTLVTVV